MKFTLLFITFVTWALWFGGTIAVFVFGLHFSHALPKPIFREAAHAMFEVFAKYEMALAGIALLTSGASLVLHPSRSSIVLVACFVLSGGMAITVALGFMPLMDSLLRDGMAESDQFHKLHGKSMIAMSIQSMVLLATGLVILLSPLEAEHSESILQEHEIQPQNA